MSAGVLWIQARTTGRWHAWLPAAGTSACRVLHAEHLRRHPPRHTQAAPPPPEEQGNVCQNCRGAVNLPPPAVVDGAVAAWTGYVRAHLRREGLRLAERDVLALAAHLAEVGPPTDAPARAVWEQVRVVLLTPLVKRGTDGRSVRTLAGVRAALAKLPPNGGAMTRVAAAMQCWRRVAGRTAALGRYRPDRVVETMLQVPDPEPYVQQLNAQGVHQLARVWHPDTLARARRDPKLHGVFAGTGDYWDQIGGQLDVARDEPR